jgi:hypothetical protein
MNASMTEPMNKLHNKQTTNNKQQITNITCANNRQQN